MCVPTVTAKGSDFGHNSRVLGLGVVGRHPAIGPRGGTARLVYRWKEDYLLLILCFDPICNALHNAAARLI